MTEWSREDREIYKSCAVVATDGKGNHVLLYTFGPAVDWQVRELGNTCDDLCLNVLTEPGIRVFEGAIGDVRIELFEGAANDLVAVGEWRDLTEKEWEFVKAGKCPWDKDTLPKWGPHMLENSSDGD